VIRLYSSKTYFTR